jgi:hypothetical protein
MLVASISLSACVPAPPARCCFIASVPFTPGSAPAYPPVEHFILYEREIVGRCWYDETLP